MKTFEEWWEKPKDHSDKYSLVKLAYEAGQRSMLPELCDEEWEELKHWKKAYNFLEDMLPEDRIDIIHSKLINHALEQRERLK